MMIKRWRSALLLALVLSAGVFIAWKGRLADDMGGFLPRGHTLEQQLLLEGLENSPAARWVLMGIAGGDAAGRAVLSREFARTLGDMSGVADVYNGGRRFGGELERTLYQYRYLLSPVVDASLFSAGGLRGALLERRRELVLGGELAERLVREDPVAAGPALFERFETGGRGRVERGAWVSGDGALALLSVRLGAGISLQAQGELLDRMRGAFRALADEQQASYALEMTGTPVLASANRDKVRANVQVISVAASVLMLMLLLAVYRSLPLALIAAVPLLCGVLAGAAAVIAVEGQIHGIALAFGMTLLGVVVDYPIHLFSHAGGGKPGAAAARLWPTLRLGAATTALAYAAFLGTDLEGLRQLGIFNIAGLLAAATVTRWVLPEWMGKTAAPALQPGWLVERRPHWLAPAAVAAAAAGYLGFGAGELWEDDPAALSPVTAGQLSTDRRLREAAGGPEAGLMLAVVGDDTQQVLARQEELFPGLELLRHSGRLDGFDAAARWVPSVRTQLQRRAALPEEPVLRERLAQAARAAAFKPGLFEPFIQSVATGRQLAPLKPEALSGTPLGERLELLLRHRGGRVFGMIPLHGGERPAELADGFAQASGGKVLSLNLRRATAELMGDFRRSALVRLAAGAMVIAVFLLVLLREPRRVAGILGVIGAALAATTALLHLGGAMLSLFHVIALLLVAGIGMDYGLFLSRPMADRQELGRTLGSVLVCALSTSLVFGALALSDIPVLRAIGLTVLTGTVVTLALTLTGLPRPALKP